MKKWALMTAIVFFLINYLVHAQKVIKAEVRRSPNGKSFAYLRQEEWDSFHHSPWQLVIDGTTFVFDCPESESDTVHGIYDFKWSPDSKKILFIFSPTTVRGVGSSEDCIGVVNVENFRYLWLDGKIVIGRLFQMTSASYGHLYDFRLKWLNSTVISYYSPPVITDWATRKRISGEGWKSIDISKVSRRWEIAFPYSTEISGIRCRMSFKEVMERLGDRYKKFRCPATGETPTWCLGYNDPSGRGSILIDSGVVKERDMSSVCAVILSTETLPGAPKAKIDFIRQGDAYGVKLGDTPKQVKDAYSGVEGPSKEGGAIRYQVCLRSPEDWPCVVRFWFKEDKLVKILSGYQP